MPTTGGLFVGREEELDRLGDAWADPGIRVLSLVASGGVGKTALVNRWLATMAADVWRGAERVLGWSFYSQGSDENRVAASDAFINYALRRFGDPDPSAGSARDRGLRLAGLIRRQPTLLVLDGIEPFQYPPNSPLPGRLKDPALAALIKALAAQAEGLCLATTRETIADLGPFTDSTAPQIDLEVLTPETGIKILRRLGVNGSEREMHAAVQEFSGHALTLTLLGTYLMKAHGGDVRCRDKVELRIADARQGGHAYGTIAAYERWLGDGPELAILRVLGLIRSPSLGTGDHSTTDCASDSRSHRGPRRPFRR